jgi:hypothetical protein
MFFRLELLWFGLDQGPPLPSHCVISGVQADVSEVQVLAESRFSSRSFEEVVLCSRCLVEFSR